jgi:hypothetical protein
LCAVASLLLATRTDVAAAAAGGLWDPAIPICDLPASDYVNQFRIRAHLIMHQHGVILRDANCPEKSLNLRDASAFTHFSKAVDPGGKRFGIPLGAGSYVIVELRGRFSNGTDPFVVDEVVRYERHSAIDPAWLADTDERGPGKAERTFAAEVSQQASPRQVRGLDSYVIVDGNLTDTDVGALFKAAGIKSASICRLTEVKQTLAQMQCNWDKLGWSDSRGWVYARDGKSWRLLKKSDGVAF